MSVDVAMTPLPLTFGEQARSVTSLGIVEGRIVIVICLPNTVIVLSAMRFGLSRRVEMLIPSWLMNMRRWTFFLPAAEVPSGNT